MNTSTVLIIVGSASPNSANHIIATFLRERLLPHFKTEIIENLSYLPHFDPDKSLHNAPPEVEMLRQKVAQASGVIFTSPEYIFSLPAVLKNFFEWCVAVTVFSGKPCALITASAEGSKAHAELELIVKTLGANTEPKTNLLVKSARAKIKDNQVADSNLARELEELADNFIHRISSQK